MKNYILLSIFLVCLGNVFAQTKTKSISFYFEFGKNVLTTNSQSDFNGFLKLAKTKHYEVNILTFCDTIGSIEYNQALSDLRLAAISSAFEKNNIVVLKKESRGENLDGYEFESQSNEKRRMALVTYEEKLKNNGTTDRFSAVLKEKDKSKIKPIALDIQFEGGTAIVLSKSLPEIDALYNFMNANKNVKALIRGHVCCENDPVISTQRANEIYQRLIRLGIDPNRLDFKGYSNTMPVVFPEVTEEDRQKNRRVDVVFELVE